MQIGNSGQVKEDFATQIDQWTRWLLTDRLPDHKAAEPVTELDWWFEECARCWALPHKWSGQSVRDKDSKISYQKTGRNSMHYIEPTPFLLGHARTNKCPVLFKCITNDYGTVSLLERATVRKPSTKTHLWVDDSTGFKPLTYWWSEFRIWGQKIKPSSVTGELKLV